MSESNWRAPAEKPSSSPRTTCAAADEQRAGLQEVAARARRAGRRGGRSSRRRRRRAVQARSRRPRARRRARARASDPARAQLAERRAVRPRVEAADQRLARAALRAPRLERLGCGRRTTRRPTSAQRVAGDVERRARAVGEADPHAAHMARERRSERPAQLGVQRAKHGRWTIVTPSQGAGVSCHDSVIGVADSAYNQRGSGIELPAAARAVLLALRSDRRALARACSLRRDRVDAAFPRRRRWSASASVGAVCARPGPCCGRRPRSRTPIPISRKIPASDDQRLLPALQAAVVARRAVFVGWTVCVCCWAGGSGVNGSWASAAAGASRLRATRVRASVRRMARR